MGASSGGGGEARVIALASPGKKCFYVGYLCYFFLRVGDFFRLAQPDRWHDDELISVNPMSKAILFTYFVQLTNILVLQILEIIS